MIYRLVPIKPGCVHLLCYSFIIIILLLCCSSALLFPRLLFIYSHLVGFKKKKTIGEIGVHVKSVFLFVYEFLILLMYLFYIFFFLLQIKIKIKK